MQKFKILLFILSLTLLGAKEHRLVTVGGSITETAIALGHEGDLIGIDLSSIYPKEIVKDIPKIGYWLQLPKEGILSLKPTMVLASERSKPKKFLSVLPSYGITTHFISDGASIESAKKKIMQVALALNEKEKAQRIINRIEKNISILDAHIAKLTKKPKVLFILNRRNGMMMAAGKETKAGTMIKLAGGINAVTFKQFTTISEESILQMNPDVIIFSNKKNKDNLKDHSILATSAGINKQIFSMDMLLISGFTVRIDEALSSLTCMLNKNELTFCK
ncbi:MAG: ABC transporter substrate-binding protein [Campylobacteraceae bacterium]|nr:ABC transporter substrate-binding protein [Campylobacteraceae bacterium]